MDSRPRGLSISYYALIMVGLVMVAVMAYAAFTISEIKRVRADIESTSSAAAREEVDAAMDEMLAGARRTASQFAAWDEVEQQLLHPRYYTYWRGRRMLEAAFVPDYVADAEVYDRSGSALAQLDTATMPSQIGTPPPPAYVDFSKPSPTLLIFRPVGLPGGNGEAAVPAGYVGLRIAFASYIRNSQAYRYADPSTIRFVRSSGDSLSWEAMKSATTFGLRANPMGEAISRLLSGAILNLGVVLGGFTLGLFAALVFLIVRPLKALSTHVDRLKDSPGGLMLDRLAGALPIAETEKIRESLNEYQEQLIDVHSSLEEKSHELWTLAHHDPLTGTKNRRAFDDYLKSLPLMLRDRDVNVCFALFDVNHFKAINDSYGHDVGDRVLKVIASRIGTVLRRGEELFRIGGDEFAVILLDCDDISARRIAERCHEKIVGQDFGQFGVREPLRISAGLAGARLADIEDLQALQWQADVAMFQAKRPGNASVVTFTEDLARDSEGLFSSWVNTAVYDAVIYGTGLHMVYQPIVEFDGGRVCHYEALVRIDRDGEVIMPSNIFPVVEARRLEVELDRAILRRVRADLAAGQIHKGTGVSINLSGPTLVHEQMCDWLGEFKPFLADYRVMIEVTETALITHIERANEHLSRLRKAGFEIALDDFGSGYSSVRYLASMPVDVVKFDTTLVQGLQDDTQRNMVEHLARMILDAGHRLVAEGIEDPATLSVVRRVGFTRGQGYLFGRPARDAERIAVGFGNVSNFPVDRGRA